ncbi:MAG: polyprenol monophosphomannose synthase [Aeromicrobium sp.]|uniref:polyprenol monophosphomannose synthase n=1 Tax=Aeromicrobium sp. TaxID=1871063 RepID=UPI0025BAF89D|nr:polyprenol monophosphomannose synthase [Aeromicrobium sp.]MDF1705104.1 polyprenol monophosphomannose synthase [Aeromicrobium sp.]
MRTLVVVPTYDEAESLPRLLDGLAVHAPTVDVLVVDDASPDGTGIIADRLARRDERVHVLHRPGKLGLGVAYRAGFAWALARDYDVIVEMDADGSHRPQDLPVLLTELARDAPGTGADLVLGSRWVPGGGVVNWPWYRKLISRGGTWYAQQALGLSVSDVTGGFRAFRRATLERLPLDEVSSQGYCFQVDLVRRVLEADMTVSEVPITFVERTRGRSKMSGSIVREALWKVTLWGVERRVRRFRRALTRRS